VPREKKESERLKTEKEKCGITATVFCDSDRKDEALSMV